MEIVSGICIHAHSRLPPLSETVVDNAAPLCTNGAEEKFRRRFHESHIAYTSCPSESRLAFADIRANAMKLRGQMLRQLIEHPVQILV